MSRPLSNIRGKFWELFSYWFYKAVDYRFRKRSIFWWGIKVFTLLLLSEIGNLISDYNFDEIYLLIETNYGPGWAIVARIIGGIIAGFASGYSWITILIKIYFITLFSILEWRKDHDLAISWKWIWVWKWDWNILFDFSTTYIAHNHYYGGIKIDKNRIEELSDSHSAESLGVKYIPELNIPSRAQKEIFNSINKTNSDKYSELNKLWGEILDSSNSLKSEIVRIRNINQFEPQLFLNNESDELNEINQLNEFLDQVLEFSLVDESNIQALLDRTKFPLVLSIPTELGDLNSAISANQFQLFDFQNEDENVGKRLILQESRNLISSIENTRRKVDSFVYVQGNIFQNAFLVHSRAGIGKTFFTGRLFDSLKESGHFPILLKATAFNGPETNLIAKLKEALDLQGTNSIEELFNELSNQLDDSKIILIIDGLNETISTTYSFSHIWKDGLHRLVKLFKAKSNLALVATCRTSYLPHINTKGFEKHSLQGFTDEHNIKYALNTYFEYYKIEANLEDANLDFFSLPLIVNIFCITKNPARQDPVKVDLSYNSYEEILDAFISSRASIIADHLDRPTATPVMNGIDRNSSLFMLEKSATLSYDDFLTATDGRNIDEILRSTSIGVSLVEEELVFLKEMSRENGEVIIHTFQNIGGYLIAKAISYRFTTAMMLLHSDYFKTYLKTDKQKKEEDYHQLYLDIIKFLVIIYSKNNDDLIEHSDDPEIINSSWDLLFETSSTDKQRDLLQKLNPLLLKPNGWDSLLEKAIPKMVKKDHTFNFNFIKEQLLRLDSFSSDLAWTYFIYSKYQLFDDFVHYSLEKREKEDDVTELELELLIWLLETTIHDLRDKVTIELIEWGSKHPKFMFRKLFEYSRIGRTYIYERLASICYGICLRKQNDQNFVEQILKPNAQRVFDFQFAKKATSPSYNYLVIDSFKHLVDLAILKGVFDLNSDELAKLKAYKFTPPNEWNNATAEDEEKVRSITVNSYHSQGPDPLRMDFVIYTISRLIIRDLEDNGDKKLSAVANIYRRILDLGYQKLKFEDRNSLESEFFYGVKQSMTGKVDRLGKKYSWIAYFDYAGHLLNQGKLDVWYPEEAKSNGEYQRLSDLHVEVSNTHPVNEQLKLYNFPMLKERGKEKDWTHKTLYHTTKELWDQKFEGEKFTLLEGKLEEKVNQSYDTRSYLMIEAFLIKRDDIKDNEHMIIGREIDWGDDLSQNYSLYGVYFGELYWADNVSFPNLDRGSIPLEEEETIERKLDVIEVALEDNFKGKAPGDIIKEKQSKRVYFSFEPATIEYLWESESDVFPTLNRRIPTTNIGEKLSLKADTNGFRFLDRDSKPATKHVEYDDGNLDQHLNYLRTDLLEKYLQEKDFVLLYQIKQHSYENVGDPSGSQFRGMQFFFPHLNKEK